MVQVATKFKNIGLMARMGASAPVRETLVLIIDYLHQRGLNPLIDDASAAWAGIDTPDIQKVTRTAMGDACDLVVVVGGDGSILAAARDLAKSQTPVMGVNRGRLGFLSDVAPEEVLQKLEQVINGQYTLDYRTMLHIEIKHNGKPRFEAMALNDCVLHAGKSVHMIDFELTIEGSQVHRQHSDGLIIATPTGSTAYGLSAGGPILHPSIDAIVLVPLNPHALSSRPIVVSGNSEIKIKMASNRVDAMVSADGQNSVLLHEGDWLHVRKHPYKLVLLHPPGYDFYAACRTKLGWHNDMD